MIYKASFYNNKINVEQVIGLKNENGEIVIAACGVYYRNLGFDNGNGVIYDGAAYATTEEVAVNRLERSLVEPILAAQDALKARLTAVTEAVRVLQVA